MPAPRLAARPTRKVVPAVAGGEGGGEQRRQGRDRAVHQPGQARLDHLQHEQPLPRGRLVRRAGAAAPRATSAIALVLALLLGQVAEQLADARVGGPPGRPPRRSVCVSSSISSRLLADGGQPQRPHQPDRPAADEPLDVLPADQRDVLAELLAVQLDQPVPVPVFLDRHVAEHLRRCRIAVAQAVRVALVNALILLFEGDCERKDLLLRQIREILHRPSSLPDCSLPQAMPDLSSITCCRELGPSRAAGLGGDLPPRRLLRGGGARVQLGRLLAAALASARSRARSIVQ